VSAQDLEIHRRLVEAYNVRDMDAFIALCDPEIQVHSVFASPGGADYVGHEGVRRWLGALDENWGDEFRVETEAFFDLGEATLMFGLLHGHSQKSDVDVEMQNAQVLRVRDGLVTYVKVYVHREDALRDLGVAEEALEPLAP
jgi:ketosteroid isomerase-like protein